MRQGSNPKRMRGRGNNRKNSNPRSHNYESNGPEVKVRGNAQQVVEKYLALARDATLTDDRVAAENYFQHAEHYYRLMTANGGGQEQREKIPQRPGDAPENREQSSGAPPAQVSQADTTELTNGNAEPVENGNATEDPASAPQPDIDGTDVARPD